MRVMPRLVLACVAVTTVLALGACAAPPTQEARSAPTAEKGGSPGGVPMELRRFDVQSKDGSVLFRLGDLHCAHPSHPLHGTYGDCNAIPVVVLENPKTGNCIALHPYANLIIHSERKRTPVVWQIVAGALHYEFDSSKDGIAISPSPGDTTDPTANYDRKQNLGKKWKWEVHEKAIYPKTFYHLPNVFDTKAKKPCVPIDPGVITVID